MSIKKLEAFLVAFSYDKEKIYKKTLAVSSQG